MKAALKIVGYFFLFFLLLAAGSGAFIWLKKDAIIAGAVERINDELTVPVQVGTIDLDLWSGFPRVRIALNNVLVEDPKGSKDALIRAEELGFGVNLWDVFRGSYNAQELYLNGGELYLASDRQGGNWELTATTDSTSSAFNFDIINLKDVRLHYLDKLSNSKYDGFVERGSLRGEISEEVVLDIDAKISEAEVMLEGERWLLPAKMTGKVHVEVGNSWSARSENTTIDGQSFAFALNDVGGEIQSHEVNVPALMSVMPLLNFEELDQFKMKSDAHWKGSYEQWELALSKTRASFTYGTPAIEIRDFTGDVRINWGAEKSIFVGPFNALTKTGELEGTARIEGHRPVLSASLQGGSNLSELFAFVEADVLVNPIGFWSGTDLELRQQFNNWEDFETVGNTAFKGNISLKECAFGISESNIEFDKVEADLVVDGRNVRIDRSFVKAGSNNAVVTGTIYDALAEVGLPMAQLRLETPFIDIDPLLFWEFEDDGQSEEDFGFDFSVDLNIDQLKLGDFKGSNLSGTVYNSGVKILGKNMVVEGCDGRFSGNWAVAEKPGGNRFWGQVQAEKVQLDQLLASFNNFDLEDLDASNLSGRASAQAELALHFNEDWDVISPQTSVEGTIEVIGGQLKNYAPLYELSAFIDSKELQRITFPELKTDFSIRGDTLFLPETHVENSALNLWVNGWQNMETDDVLYSVRLGLKDLALRGKNSNRDLGYWIQEAENENQPYIRLLVGCNLDDVCISLDKATIKKNLKESLAKEKQDLKQLFNTEREEPKQPSNSGTFELVWPEDSLNILN